MNRFPAKRVGFGFARYQFSNVGYKIIGFGPNRHVKGATLVAPECSKKIGQPKKHVSPPRPSSLPGTRLSKLPPPWSKSMTLLKHGILNFVLVVVAHGYAASPAFQGLRSCRKFRISLGSLVCPWTRKDQSLASWHVEKARILTLPLLRNRVAHCGKAKGADSKRRDLDDLRRQGFEAAMTGQFQAAADILEEYLSRANAADLSALNCRGAMLAELSKYDSAEECFQV
eukprot:1803940-Rhodomonas_salina.4